MNDPEAADLTAFDPERDPRRWSHVKNATRFRVAQVILQRNRGRDPLAVVSGWASPILATAATILLLLGAANVLIGRPDPPAASEARRLAYLTEAAVLRGHGPTGAELMAAIHPREAR